MMNSWQVLNFEMAAAAAGLYGRVGDSNLPWTNYLAIRLPENFTHRVPCFS